MRCFSRRALGLLFALPYLSDGRTVDRTMNTAGFANGRQWKVISFDSKISYLNGYLDSMNWIAGITDYVLDKPQSKLLRSTETAFFPETMNLGEISASLDKFYEEPTSAIVPVAAMLCVVVMKANGQSQAEIDKRMEANRAYYVNK